MGDYAERDPWTGRMEGRNMTPNELGREAARRDIATMREHLDGAPLFADCQPPAQDLSGWRRPDGSVVVCRECSTRLCGRGFSSDLKDLEPVFGEELPHCSLCGMTR